jgi:hypothetical protein
VVVVCKNCHADRHHAMRGRADNLTVTTPS